MQVYFVEQTSIAELYDQLLQKRVPHKTPAENLTLILRERPEAVLISIDPGDKDASDAERFIRLVRRHSYVPIVVCGQENTEVSIATVKAGADRYIPFPCRKKEFLLHIASVLRLSTRPPYQPQERLESGVLLVDLSRHEVSVNKKRVDLTPTEYRFLVLLMSNPERVFDPDSIYEAVWNQDSLGSLDPIKWHVSNLRTKLQLPEDYIQTVRGHGYRFVGPKQLQKTAS